MAQFTTSTNYTNALNTQLPAYGQVAFPATQAASSDPNTFDDYEEGTSTPTVTASSGTFTSVAATLWYRKLASLWLFAGAITITTVGTASGSMSMTLPFTTTNVGHFGAREQVNTGTTGGGRIDSASTSVTQILKYDNSSWIGAGAVVRYGGFAPS
jgi:hypothetical protein